MATSFHKVNNNAASVLASAIDDNDLALSVSSGDGAEFDSVLQFLTLGRDETYAGEVVEASSRSTDAFTLAARAQDGTTATAHDAGVRVECLLVAAHINEIQDAINAIENGTTTLAKVITSGTAANTHTIDDSATNTVVSVLELYKTSSGTPASGIGAKVLLGGEDSAGNAEAAIEIHGYLTTVTSTSEQGAFLLRVKNAGSFMDALAITVASNTVTVGSNQTTVNLWNSTTTTVNAWNAATTLNIATAGTNPVCTFGAGTSSTLTLNFATVRNTAGSVVVLWNTGSTTVSVFGAATSITMGASNSGTCTIRNATVALSGTTAFTVAAPSTFSGNVTLADGINFVFNTTTGTKIGTATTQKIGFFNKTPVVQRAKASYNNWAAFTDVVNALVDLGLFDAA